MASSSFIRPLPPTLESYLGALIHLHGANSAQPRSHLSSPATSCIPSLFELFSVTCNAFDQCLQADSSALLQLKRGFTLCELDTWRLGTNCCIWEGVTCDDESGRVIGLDLKDRSITGKIDASLFNLTALRALNFANNWFEDIPIPDYGWYKLANLSKLDLSTAGFVGNVPAGISRLSRLTYLGLSTNLELSLTSSPTLLTTSPTLLRNMTSLRELYLDFINLSPHMNGWCNSLVNSTLVLEVLSMAGCSLFGTDCFSLSMLPLLSVVNLGDNNLDSRIFNSCVNFTSLSELVVQENGLKGIFPKQIFQLRNLKSLDISYNPMLSGSLPDFSEDNNLNHLMLSGTNFSGNLPDTIGNLKFLTSLEISNCQFSDRIPPTMRNLSQLVGLNLSYNNFSGVVELEFIKDLKNLIFLDLSKSGFSLSSWDADDGTFSSFFSNLLFLRLAGCNLTKIPASINNHHMEELYLSNNNIHGEIPSWFWSITRLNLSCNFFTHVVEPSFNLFAYNLLIFIDLHSNMLEGPIPRLPPTDIMLLDFSNNRFSSFIPSNIFSHIKSTRLFSLANNNLTGEIPPSICNLVDLMILDLSNNNLTGSIPPCLLEDGIYLNLLNLRRNQLLGAIPQELSPKCKLQTINLRDNQLEGLLPRSLTNCRSLKILDLGNNNLKDTFPYWLGNIPMLTVLVLRSNKFHGLIGALDGNHKANHTFSMLHVFDISSNNFSGKLYEDSFSNFKSMMVNRGNAMNSSAYDVMGTYYDFDEFTILNKRQLLTLQKLWMMVKSIDVSNNHFEGEIPIAIGQLISLQVLGMSQNYLTGKIPPQIGNLLQLESLDLSMNSLSGKIPQELVSLHFLSFLNLSYNKLVGKIPMGGQFSTFPNSSFEGNEGLCYWSPHNTSVTGAVSPPSLHGTTSKNRSYMIVLGMIFGVGFGVCMATVVVLDVIYCDKGKRRRSRRPLQG